MRPLVAVILVASAGLAGCIGDEETSPAASTNPAEADTTSTGGQAAGPDAVIAFGDTGINPYHADFRTNASRAQHHPSTYLPTYPENATALNLTFDHDGLEDAIAADCQEWASLEPGQLYWVPGTRIVGLMHPYAGEFEFTCEDAGDSLPPFLHDGSHGTGVASRGAGQAYGACSECLIVAVKACCPPHEDDRAKAVEWSANQSWIDVQSNSWGLPVDACPEQPRVVRCPTPSFARTIEKAASQQPSFWATGNGATTTLGVTNGGLVGGPTKLDFGLTPSVIRVGAHDSGHLTIWHGWTPHVVSDGCNAWTAEHQKMSGVTPDAFGTSFSTPFAAGIAGKILLEARTILQDNQTGVRGGVLAEGEADGIGSGPLADGTLTIEELKRVLYTTADPRPEEIEEDGETCNFSPDVEWRQVPEGPAGIPLIGYGAVTPATAEHATEVLQGEEPMPERPNEDAYFEVDRTYRETVHEEYTATGVQAVEAGR